MKLQNNLYSRLTLITSVTLVTGYGLVYAWTTLNPIDAGANKPLTAALMQGIVNNINELNTNLTSVTGKVGTLTNGKWCTTDGTKIDCTTDAPVAGGSSLWNTGASNTINYTTGNVGIGTASPSTLLHLRTTTGTNAEMDIQSGIKPKWGMYHDETTEQLRFWNGADRVSFSSGGNVGIGTASLANKFQVYTSGPFGGPVTSGTTQTNGIARISGGDATLDFGIFSNGATWLQTTRLSDLSNVFALALNPNGGNVAIGTGSTPASPLFVNGPAGSPSLVANSAVATINTVNNNQLQIGGILASPYSMWLQATNVLSNNLSYPIALNPSGGNVGIGTTTPLSKLHIQDSAQIVSFTGTTRGTLTLSAPYVDGYFQAIDFLYSPGSHPTARIGVKNTGGGTFLNFGTSNIYASGITNTAMTIGPAGNVGIGTTAPAYKLDVDNAMRLKAAAGNSRIEMRGGSDGGSSSSMYIYNPSNQLNTVFSDGTYNSYMNVYSGNVGIGTATPGYKLHVAGATGVGIYSTSDNNYAVMGVSTSGYGVGGYSTSGWGIWCGSTSCGGTAGWTNSSDARLKKDIHTIDGALEKILGLRGVTYHWKDQKTDQKEGERIGFIAQEVEKIFPQVVKTDTGSGSLPGGTKMISYAELISPLVEAAKELSHKLDELFAKYLDQQQEIDSLKARMDALERK